MAKKMTLRQTLEKMVKLANALPRDAGWFAQQAVWDVACEWNKEHGDDEQIFMCEHENEETGYVDGFYIEDDYWTFED